MTVAHLRGASVRFDDGTVVALPDLDLASGERVAVAGANGSGKSTLLRALAGVVSVAGTFTRNAGTRDAGSGGVAWVAQRPFLFRGTAAENVALALVRSVDRPGERRSRALAALAALGAADLAERPARALSEGQAMRVALARALVAVPSLLLLDEALAPLDADGARRAAQAVLAVPGLTLVAAAPSESSLTALRPTRVVRL